MTTPTLTDRELERWLNVHLFGMPELDAGVVSEAWARGENDAAGFMLAVLMEMKARGYQALISVSPTGGHLVGFGLAGVTPETRNYESLPRAVADAARAALEASRPS